MSFRKNLEKLDFKGDFTIDVIEQIIAAHNADLERIEKGMDIPFHDGCETSRVYQLEHDQSHVRKEQVK